MLVITYSELKTVAVFEFVNSNREGETGIQVGCVTSLHLDYRKRGLAAASQVCSLWSNRFSFAFSLYLHSQISVLQKAKSVKKIKIKIKSYIQEAGQEK